MESYIEKAKGFFDAERIDSSMYYIGKCYDIDRDYPPAHHLEGVIYLYRDGIYNRRLSASELRQAARMEDDNPEYRYDLGTTLERQGYYQNALHEYEAAAKLDSTDSRPLERIAEINRRIGVRYDDRKYFERSLKASAKAAAITCKPGDFYSQGIALYQMREYESSGNVLLQGLGYADSDSMARNILLLLGTDLVGEGKFDSADVVFNRALKIMSDAARDQLEDPRFLMPPDQYKAYQQESSYSQKRFKQQFWGRLDPDPTTGINERKLEHFARQVHARLTFSVPDKSIDGCRTRRGEIYIRYGPPSEADYVLGTGGGMDAPKWVWRYAQFDEPITLIFEDTFLNGDFDFPYPNKDWTSADYARDPSRLALMLESSVAQTFAYSAGSGSIDYLYMPRQFKGVGGKTALEVFVAIPYPQLSFRRSARDAYAEVEWRQTLRYGSWRLADSAAVLRTYWIRASQVDNARLSVADRLSISAYPDSLFFSIAIQDTVSDHLGIDTREMRLRDFYTGKVEISDIVLARRIDSPPDNKRHDRKDLRIISNLDNRYFVGEPIWLYFEIYNLQKDSNERTSYTLKETVRERKKGGLLAGIKDALRSENLKEVSISYSGASIYSDENRILSIDVSDLDPGDYTILMEVTDQNSGRTTSTQEDVVLYR